MLHEGLDANTISDFGSTLLAHAASTSSEIIVRMLLKYGADPYLTTKFGNTALHVAAYRDVTFDVFADVFAAGPRAINMQRCASINGWTPLHFLAAFSFTGSDAAKITAYQKKVACALSYHDIDVSIRDGSGDTAETLARRNHNHGMADALQLYANQQGRWQHQRRIWTGAVVRVASFCP
jgi:ankyrin repeat protein